VLVLALSALGTTGCGAMLTATLPTPELYGYAVVDASAVPVSIDAYPHVYWNGAYAYLVDGRWYYPTDSGWVVFREEPRDLYQYRIAIRQGTPPPVVEYGYGYRGGPAVQTAPPAVQTAPPARRRRPDVQTAPPAPSPYYQRRPY
jgi:hypothetical protein